MVSETGVKKIKSEEEFESAVADGVCVVDFYAPWCGPCTNIAPKFAELALHDKYKDVRFIKVDTDEFGNLAEEQEVQGLPTFKFFKDGKLCHTIVGASVETFPDILDGLMFSANTTATVTPSTS